MIHADSVKAWESETSALRARIVTVQNEADALRARIETLEVALGEVDLIFQRNGFAKKSEARKLIAKALGDQGSAQPNEPKRLLEELRRITALDPDLMDPAFQLRQAQEIARAALGHQQGPDASK